MEDRKNLIGAVAITGLVIGVVITTLTREWWWIGVCVAVGLSIEAVRRSG